MSANCPEVKFPEHRLYLPEKGNALPNTGADPAVAAAYAAAQGVAGLDVGVNATEVHTAATLGEAAEYTGGSVSYYKVRIGNSTSGVDAYTAECNDIIEALGMNYAEGNAFKAIWRRCAARTLGLAKAGYKDGLYDAEKVVFFGERMVAQEKAK